MICPTHFYLTVQCTVYSVQCTVYSVHMFSNLAHKILSVKACLFKEIFQTFKN